MIFLVLESSAVTQPMSVRGYRFCARALPPGQTPVSDSPSPLWPEFQRRPHRPGDVALSRLSGWAESSVPSRGPAGLGEVRVGQCYRVVVTCGGLSVRAVTPASVVTPAPVQPPRCCGPRVLCHEDRGPGVLRTRSPFRPRQPARGDLGPAPGLAPPGTRTPQPRSPGARPASLPVTGWTESPFSRLPSLHHWREMRGVPEPRGVRPGCRPRHRPHARAGVAGRVMDVTVGPASWLDHGR